MRAARVSWPLRTRSTATGTFLGRPSGRRPGDAIRVRRRRASCSRNLRYPDETSTVRRSASERRCSSLQRAVTDGTPDVFQPLANLRNTMNSATVATVSGQPVNQPGQSILGFRPPRRRRGQLASTAPQVSTVVLRRTYHQLDHDQRREPWHGPARNADLHVPNATTATAPARSPNQRPRLVGGVPAGATPRTDHQHGQRRKFAVHVVDDVPGGTTQLQSVFHLQSQATDQHLDPDRRLRPGRTTC